ncbi:biliverdin-producing heme oxygenase [Acidocella sp. MX-AZ03]|uniref:biliverdin-producing heme oxygenase n=1 Tax=Acidocella sp. MX-AZ03 TaxID=2697363 RepID=UPI0022DD91CD|nr:biliverdin-producing heme oxygenase [Acidocella sp. MX-AZ03]WBO59776.1 biliverdin-producing heme oxygenase [Acidocella sp. MX-AZ03]
MEAALAPLRLLPADAYELTASLEADLADLGTAPLGATPPVGFARGSGWGCLYVLQGSNLGALQLRGWAQALGFDGAHGARHLALQAQRARHWRGFVARLNAQSFSPAEEQECAAGPWRRLRISPPRCQGLRGPSIKPSIRHERRVAPSLFGGRESPNSGP